MTNEDLCSIFFTAVKFHLKSTRVSEPIIFSGFKVWSLDMKVKFSMLSHTAIHSLDK